MKRTLVLLALAASAVGAMATPSFADLSETSRSVQGEPPPSYSVPLSGQFNSHWWGGRGHAYVNGRAYGMRNE